MFLHTNLLMLAGALLLDAAFGYPDWLVRAIGHPVMWTGALIGTLDRHLPRTRRAGVLALVVLLLTCVPPAALPWLLPASVWRLGLLILLAAPWPAQHSLYLHVRAVADALDTGGLEAGRAAVSRIVGRDTASLDEAAVARAAIESLAENFRRRRGRSRLLGRVDRFAGAGGL